MFFSFRQSLFMFIVLHWLCFLFIWQIILLVCRHAEVKSCVSRYVEGPVVSMSARRRHYNPATDSISSQGFKWVTHASTHSYLNLMLFLEADGWVCEKVLYIYNTCTPVLVNLEIYAEQRSSLTLFGFVLIYIYQIMPVFQNFPFPDFFGFSSTCGFTIGLKNGLFFQIPKSKLVFFAMNPFFLINASPACTSNINI